MNPSSLRFPKKSHRKSIDIPKESEKLAEFMGIMFGDGGISNPWQLVISLNSISDLPYSLYATGLIRQLFVLEIATRKRLNQNTLVLVCSSATLVDFLVEKGFVRGNKVFQQIDISTWIAANQNYGKFFVRGLVDTDGCLYIHKHFTKGKFYANIGFCFTSFSKKLTFSVAKILNIHGIKPHVTDGGRRVYLYNQEAIGKYLNIFGSSNPRILEKYDEWRSRIVVHSTRLESARARAHAGSNPASSAHY